MKSLYIAWASYQRRAVSMQPYLGYTLHHLPPSQGGKFSKLAGYVKQSISTLQLVRNSEPDVVWVQLPPNFIAHLLILSRMLSGKKFKIVLDCHNAALRAPWLSTPFFGWACRASDLVIVHNEEVLRDFPIRLGVESPAIVLEDPPSNFLKGATNCALEGFVLVPCSFHDDEPIEMILATARQVPEIKFKITGRLEKARAKGYLRDVPVNVVFTDFVSEDRFNKLLHTCSVVAGLTTYEGIQLSVASEAIGAGKALILSGTRVLRSMFADCALFFENTDDEFANAVRTAISDRAQMEERSRASLTRRVASWKTKASSIQRMLSDQPQ